MMGKDGSKVGHQTVLTKRWQNADNGPNPEGRCSQRGCDWHSVAWCDPRFQAPILKKGKESKLFCGSEVLHF